MLQTVVLHICFSTERILFLKGIIIQATKQLAMDTLYTFKIPDTIITDILDLVSSDIATLHSCLLANRYLFHATVSHLYANPFPLLSTVKAQSLIETLTFCAVKTPPSRPTINYASLVERLSIVSLWTIASVDHDQFNFETQGNFMRAEALIVALVRESMGNLKELHWSSYPLVEFGIPNIIPRQGELITACLRQNPYLRVLTFTGDPPFDVAMLDDAENEPSSGALPISFPCLTELRFKHFTASVDGFALWILKRARRVRVFELASLAFTPVEDGLLEVLVRHPVQELYLERTILKTCSISKLAQLKDTLLNFKLHKSKDLTDAQITPVLTQCCQLQTIDLSNAQLTSTTMCAIVPPFFSCHSPSTSALTYLNISGIPTTCTVLLKIFAAHPNIAYLKIHPLLAMPVSTFLASLADALPLLENFFINHEISLIEDLVTLASRCPCLVLIKFLPSDNWIQFRRSDHRRIFQEANLRWPNGREKVLVLGRSVVRFV